MSQGDYLKHKINSHLLKDQLKFQPVIDSRKYSEFKRYQLANSITNSNISYQQLEPTGKQTVFDMEKVVSGCPEFLLCDNASSRPYRTPAHRVPFSARRPCPAAPLYVKDPSNSKTACDCAKNQSTSNPCKCATSQ